jgi:hypothetical protein
VRRLRIGVIDLVTRGPTRALYARVMNANLASITPQVVGVWCEAEGHEVTFHAYRKSEEGQSRATGGHGGGTGPAAN